MNNVSIYGWNDSNNEIRQLITDSVLAFLAKEFNAGFILDAKIEVRPKPFSICGDKSVGPCICYNRQNSCLSTYDKFWCQFIYQISHELCHAITSQKELPQGIKWFDEFICCFASHYVLIAVGNNLIPQLNYLYQDTQQVFKEYFNQEQKEHIYDVENSQEFFSNYYQQYLKDENLIKMHDVFYRRFYESLNGESEGLSIIGKFKSIVKNPQMSLNDFFASS